MKKLFLTSIYFLLLCTYSTNIQSQSIYSKKVNDFKNLLEGTELSKNYNGSILIADGQKVLLERSYGSNENNELNQINTKYDIASMGKMFTAVTILQLEESKQLSLDQSIGEILDDYPNEDAKRITVRQLLSHTSGLGDFFGPEFDQQKESVKTLQDYLPFFVDDPLEFNPGERMRYSNAGFIVLGLIIEKITDTDYNNYVTQNILQPTKMASTGPLLSSAGGGDSTVADFHKFAIALKDNDLINGESFSSMTTDHFENGYGFGMSLRDLNGKKVYGHNGGAPGISGELDLVKEEPLIIITLSNRSAMDGWAQVRTNIRKTFFGNTPEIEQFLNTERVMKTYQEQGFDRASELLTELNNNISDRNTFGVAEKYASQGEMNKAVDMLKLIVQAYPTIWQPYSYLADFQMGAGQTGEAIKNYEKSLEINPENQHAIEQLKQLSRE